MKQDQAAIISLTLHQSFNRPLLLSLIGLLLAGCGSNPPAPVQDGARVDSGQKTASAAPSYRSGKGAYYLDDGPGDNIPPGLENTPDAVPKVEPILARTSRPYVVFGKTYTPMAADQPYRQRGVGSWYGRRYHGQRTSSGEPYDMFAMTAAHPTLPIPSYVRVTHLATGRQVIVRVNDRGPFLSERIIDLSYTAALKLGYLNHGSSQLEVERLMPDEIERINAARSAAPAEPATASVSPVPSPSVTPTALANPSPVAAAAAQDKLTAAAGGWYLQLGAFSQPANAEQARQKLAASLPGTEVVQLNGLYRLYAGPWASRAQAEAALETARSLSGSTPIVVQR